MIAFIVVFLALCHYAIPADDQEPVEGVDQDGAEDDFSEPVGTSTEYPDSTTEAEVEPDTTTSSTTTTTTPASDTELGVESNCTSNSTIALASLPEGGDQGDYYKNQLILIVLVATTTAILSFLAYYSVFQVICPWCRRRRAPVPAKATSVAASTSKEVTENELGTNRHGKREAESSV